MRLAVPSLVVLCSLLCSAGAYAQSGSLRISDMRDDEREVRTLSRAKAPRDGCAISARVPSLHPEAHTRLATAVAAIGEDRAGSVLFSVSIDSTKTVRARVIETSLQESDVASIAAALQGGTVLASDSAGSLRVRVDVGPPQTTIRTAGIVSCGPSLKNRADISKGISDVVRKLGRTVRRGEPLTTVVWVLLRENGTVSKGRVKESSGNQQADDLLLEMFVKRARFEPAIMDGARLEVWAQVPLIVRVQ